MRYANLTTTLLVLAVVAGAWIHPNGAAAGTAAELDREAKSALQELYAEIPSARMMGERAKGILVFPSIVKGGFLVGGQYGEGALLKNGKTERATTTRSRCRMACRPAFRNNGYAMFFMTGEAMEWLDRSDGWEVGAGPSIVVVDTGKASSMTTTTLQSDIYAFFFDQQGLMAGLGLQGTKITRIQK